MAPRTPGLLPLPSSAPALGAELGRLERELEHAGAPLARRLLALERRRTLIALDALCGSSSPAREPGL